MVRSLFFALLTASSALLAYASVVPSSDYSGGLVYGREADYAHIERSTERPARSLERRTGLVPHVPSANIVLSPSGGAYPRVTSLSDGSYLAVFTTSSGGNKTLTVTRSTDGGNTFSAWSTIATSPRRVDAHRGLSASNIWVAKRDAKEIAVRVASLAASSARVRRTKPSPAVESASEW